MTMESRALAFAGEVRRLDGLVDPMDGLRRLAHLPHCLLLHSSQSHPELGRYSFLAADPWRVWRAPGYDDPRCRAELATTLDQVRQAMVEFHSERVDGLPPFQGGLAGVLSYELGRFFEDLPAARYDDLPFPQLVLGLYDVVVAWDHVAGGTWLISQGFPEWESAARRRRAVRRADEFERCLGTSRASQHVRPVVPIPRERLAPQWPVPGMPGVASSFSREAYLDAVARAIEYVWAGDIFQVNLAQRLITPARAPSIALAAALSRENPAPFSAYYDLDDMQVISASPERFLAVRDGRVESRPIKGTRPRTGDPAQDRAWEAELLASAKDRAENVMIVDLMRNDLARVSEDDSVDVVQLAQIERYAAVVHLVSAVTSRLRSDCDVVELLKATFPGGSVTGAPKIRAMQIIAELEPVARGAYCGSIGYWGFDGTADWNLLIRTITAAGGFWQIPVGGGIVADSQPADEYDETMAKAEGLLRAVHSVDPEP